MRFNKTQIIQQLTTGKTVVLIDQAIVSGGNFVLGILLARMLGLEQFGLYSLLWMGVLFGLSLHQAFVTKPLFFLYVGKKDTAKASYLSSLFKIQMIISVGIVLLSFGAFGIQKWVGANQIWIEYVPITAAITAAYLLQDFLRKSFFVKKQYLQPLFMDLFLYTVMVGGLCLSYYTETLNLGRALWIILGAYSLSSSFYTVQAFFLKNKDIDHTSGAPVHKTFKEHYHYSVWLLGTSLVQWFSGNFFLVAAAAILGTVAVGALRMAQNMVGLCHVLFLAMENIVPVEAAQQFFKNGKPGMYNYLWNISLKASVAVGILLIGLTMLAPWLIGLLYGSDYRPYSYLVGSYAILYVFVFFGYPLRFALRSLQFTSPIFVAYCISAAISVFAAFPMTRAWGIAGVVAGLIGTQVLTLVVYLFFLAREKKSARGLSF